MVLGISKALLNLDLAVNLTGEWTTALMLSGLMRMIQTVWYPGKTDGPMPMRHGKRQDTETYTEDFK